MRAAGMVRAGQRMDSPASASPLLFPPPPPPSPPSAPPPSPPALSPSHQPVAAAAAAASPTLPSPASWKLRRVVHLLLSAASCSLLLLLAVVVLLPPQLLVHVQQADESRGVAGDLLGWESWERQRGVVGGSFVGDDGDMMLWVNPGEEQRQQQQQQQQWRQQRQRGLMERGVGGGREAAVAGGGGGGGGGEGGGEGAGRHGKRTKIGEQMRRMLVESEPSSSSSSASSSSSEEDLKSAEDREEKFIYVYDLGPETTVDVRRRYEGWWSEQYESEEIVYGMLFEEGIARTEDPEKASLFFVPFFFSRQFMIDYITHDKNATWTTWEAAGHWARLLKRVEAAGPWFRRNNGRDHFAVNAFDHGRCSAFTFLQDFDFDLGEMFFLQTNGDRMVRSNNVDKSGSMVSILYDPQLPRSTTIPSIKCYEEDRDIVLPPASFMKPSVPPKDWTTRSVASFRFWTHNYIFEGHQIRQELFDLFEKKNIPGWLFGSQWSTDWGEASFCVCPPGHSQWTSRPFKAILKGSIPVTFFRYHDNPWQDTVDYSKFTINIDPSAIYTLQSRLEEVMEIDGFLDNFFMNLVKVQEHFQWQKGLKHGVLQHIIDALKKKACLVGATKENISCP